MKKLVLFVLLTPLLFQPSVASPRSSVSAPVIIQLRTGDYGACTAHICHVIAEQSVERGMCRRFSSNVILAHASASLASRLADNVCVLRIEVDPFNKNSISRGRKDPYPRVGREN